MYRWADVKLTLLVFFLATMIPSGLILGQDIEDEINSMTSDQIRTTFLQSAFQKMVASHYTDDNGKRLTIDDFHRQSQGAIRHSKKQVLSNRTSEVRLSRDGRSFVSLKCDEDSMTASMHDHSLIEFQDLLSFSIDKKKIESLLDECVLKIIEERKDDKEDPFRSYNGGRSRIEKCKISELPGFIAFRITVNEQAEELDDSARWSTITAEWSYVGEDEETAKFLP